MSSPRRRILCILPLVLGAAPLLAQEPRDPRRRDPYVAYPDRPAEDEYPLQEPSDALPDPVNAFELALSDDGLWFGYRNGLHRGRGYFALEFFGDQENDYALDGRLMRFSEPSVESPFAFGVGLGAFGGVIDETDTEILAITITGAVDFELDEYLVLSYPTRIGTEVSYAPDVATFIDGERVLDILSRVEIDISPWASAFVGYRHLEVEVEDEDEDDFEFDSSFQAGVRLGF
jgi:hypothetical protein